jgi:uncharacterized protein YeaO (DUF488 family)
LTVLPEGASLLASFMFFTKRIYDPAEAKDGKRFLVDRLWPRGLSKHMAKLDGWLKEIAPSDALRKRFHHDPERWKEFRKRYSDELKEKLESVRPLVEAGRKGNVTLLFGAKDFEHNNAIVLKAFLSRRSACRERRPVTTAANARRSSRSVPRRQA